MGHGSREKLHDFIPVYYSFIFTHPKIKGGGGFMKESCLSTKTSAEIISLSSKRKKERRNKGRGKKEKGDMEK